MNHLIEIHFDREYEQFKKYVESKSGKQLTDFKDNAFVDSQEGYKSQLLVNARNALIRDTWKVEEIGNGEITKYVKRSLQAKVRYKGENSSNNLIDWRKIDDFNKKEFSLKEEQLFFDFFKSKQKPERSFKQMEALDYSYQVIAYLFFINNPQGYCPISQQRFDLIFDSLNLDFKTSNSRSWENYCEFNQIIKDTKKLLSKKHQNISLLDAHSFLWIYGQSLVIEKEDSSTVLNKDKKIIHNLAEAEAEAEAEAVSSTIFPDELKQPDTLFEGVRKRVTVNSYERNQVARAKCIEYYQAKCSVCEFDFTETYGDIGFGFIHVHHLTQLSDIKQGYEVNPIQDLRPVCPNCHAMLHKRNPPFTVEELKEKIKNT